MSLPDDLDDTALSLENILRCDRGLFSSQFLKSFIDSLLICSRQAKAEEVCYNTWILPRNVQASGESLDTGASPESWEDIDIVVQVATYKLLRRFSAVPESFTSFLKSRVRLIASAPAHELGKLACSKYYHRLPYIISELLMIEGVKRSDKLAIENRMRQFQALENSTVGTYVNLAAAVSGAFPTASDSMNLAFETLGKVRALRSCGPHHRILDEVLRGTELLLGNSDGFRYEPFYIESNRSLSETPESIEYAGSHILTKSAGLYCMLAATNAMSESTSEIEMQRDMFSERAIGLFISKTQALASFKTISEHVFKLSEKGSFRLLSRIAHEIFDWAGNTLQKDLPLPASLFKKLLGLSVAIMQGWVSYSIYDSILDDELEATYLPLANTCSREMLSTCLQACPDPYVDLVQALLFQADKEQYLASVDRAFLAGGARRSDPSRHATRSSIEFPGNKSIAHSIGPIIAYALGNSTANRKIRREDLHHITEAYRFYLSIKQLSDDAHDWESDIENDIQTFVTEIVIGELEKRSIHEKDPKAAEGPEPDVVSKETMRDIFLGKALPIVYEKTVEYSKGAYMHLDLLSCMQSTGFIRSEIERYCHAAWQALCESRAFHPDLHRDDGAASNAT